MTSSIRIALIVVLSLAVACGDDDGTNPEDAAVSLDSATGQDGSVDVDGSSQPDASTPSDASTQPDGGTPPTPADCPALPAATGNTLEVYPGDADTLRQTVLDAPSGTTILLHDGDYAMDGGDNSHMLSFRTNDVTLRSYSGNRSAVTLNAGYVTGTSVAVEADDITIADITLREAYNHPIHVTGGDSDDTTGTLIYNVHILDPGQQAIKINTNSHVTFADDGRIECSRLELTDAGRPHIRDSCYTGGVDGHQAWGWEIRLNHIEGFWCSSGLSEHGVHFWTASRDTVVERNTIVDCARGIGFGMGETGAARTYSPDPYPSVGYIGHYDGIIRNNMIFADIGDRFDSGISLDQAHGAQVLHNTIVSTVVPFNCIEWRFDNANVTVTNNLVSHNLMDRGGNAILAGNIENAPMSMFVNGPSGALHLASGAAAIDSGVAVSGGLCTHDIDGDVRSGTPDVGADER